MIKNNCSSHPYTNWVHEKVMIRNFGFTKNLINNSLFSSTESQPTFTFGEMN